MNTDNTTILNIERGSPQSGERTFSVVNPNEQIEHKLRLAAYCRVSSDSEDQLNSYACCAHRQSKPMNGGEYRDAWREDSAQPIRLQRGK